MMLRLSFIVLFINNCLMAQSLQFNEFMMGSDVEGTGGVKNWVELINVGNDVVSMSDFYLTTDTLSGLEQQFTAGTLEPFQFFYTTVLVELNSDSPYLALVNKNNGAVQDLILQRFYPRAGESLARFPDGDESMYYFKDEMATPGSKNQNPGPWKKIATRTSFSPRDSSPNACVVHNDSIYVLAGYRYENNTWDSKSDSYRSGDGVEWQLLNASLPYSPYSAFISFKGYIWAFGTKSYKSQNGIAWQEVDTNISLESSMKVTSLHDSLFAVAGKSIYSSRDGESWNIVTVDAPWETRAWPGLVAVNNKLFFMGGGSGYNTGSDYYFTDVWSSGNGKDWTKVTDNAPFQKSYWARYHAFDNKIWVMAGWDYYTKGNEEYGNNNEVWVSSDGASWERINIQHVWEPRHAAIAFTFKGSLYVSSGYGGGGIGRMYNDVWQFHPIEQEILANDVSTTYGDASFFIQANASSGLPLHYQIINSNIAEVSESTVIIKNAGETQISIYQAGSNIFLPAQKEVTLHVQKKTLTAKAEEVEKEFGKDLVGPTIIYDGFVGDDSPVDLDQPPVVHTEASIFSSVGTYDLLLTGGVDNNYDFQFLGSKITIKPSNDAFNVFPNPTVDFINLVLQYPPHSEDNLSLYGSRGGKVMSVDFNPEQNFYALDVTALEKGLYTYRILNGGKVIIGRIVLE